MADIEIKINNNAVQANKPLTPVQNKPVETGVERKPEAEREQSTRVERELENVVSVSEDGDTVQVTDESSERLEEDAFGTVAVRNENPAVEDEMRPEEEKETVREELSSAEIKKSQEAIESPTKERIREAQDPAKVSPAKERLEELREDQEAYKAERSDMIKEELRAERTEENEQEEAEKRVTTYNGYTEQQLQEMVRDGEISQNDYNQEMEAREERTEALVEQNNEFSNEMAEDISNIELTERQAEELKTVFAEDSASVPDAPTRAEILDKLQDFTLNN